MFPVLQVGPIAIPVPAFTLLLGGWLSLTLSERQAVRRGVNPGKLWNLALTAIIAGVVAGRLGFFLSNPRLFSGNMLDLFSRDPSLFDPFLGFFGAAIGALIYAQRNSMKVLPTLDALTPGMAVMMVALGLAHLASGDAFGSETNLPWAISLWGANRHPTQVYEIAAGAIILLLFWPGRKWVESLPSGVPFFVLLAIASGSRLFLEAFRGDSTVVFGGIRVAQIIAWLLLATGIVGIYRLWYAPSHMSSVEIP